MKTIRTKGPWLFGEPFAGKYSIYGDMGRRDPELIAAVTSLVDAQFILAAPEMYEALKRALEFIQDSEGLTDSGELECGVIARAAIAKAEGR